jgi:4-amino-4-deoxy-L-arabinose transferase-like glycosyltransferase
MSAMRVGRVALSIVAIGIVYALSPMTVWFAFAIVPIVLAGVHGLDAGERRWVTRIVVVAIALRILAIVALFLLTDHSLVPFGSLFGDEEYFIKRSLWLRNLAFDIPLHRFDLEYAFEPHGSSRYLYLLALIQVLAGPAPYGLHLVGVLAYVAAVLLLYRLVRTTFGRMPALFGLAVLVFLPSLFAWSVSVLKEPVFVLCSALSLVFAVRLVRAPSQRSRALALSGIIAISAALESIRRDGAAFGLLGLLVGLTIAFLAMRPRFMLAALVATPIVLGAVLSRPDVQLRAFVAIVSAARQHWGMVVVSHGHPYQLLDERFYPDMNEISDLRFGETLRFLVRAVVTYVTAPLPWKAQSRAAVAYLPEQIVWYLLAALAVIGALRAFRYDALVAGLLVGHALVVFAAVAFTSGNIGTLVRHRGLALPYIVWLSGVGACELLARLGRAWPARPSVRVLSPLPDMRSM